MNEKERYSMIHATFKDWLDNHIEQMNIEEIDKDFYDKSSGCGGASVLLRTGRFRWLTAFYNATMTLRDESKSKDKQIQTLNERLGKLKVLKRKYQGTAGRYLDRAQKAEKENEELDGLLSDTSAGRVALNARAIYKINIELLEERDILNERIARMGEYVGSVQQELIATDNPVCDQQPLIDDLEKALSSHNPKWIEGVRAEAKAKVALPIENFVLETMEGGMDSSLECVLKKILGLSQPFNIVFHRQPNQSREKMG